MSLSISPPVSFLVFTRSAPGALKDPDTYHQDIVLEVTLRLVLQSGPVDTANEALNRQICVPLDLMDQPVAGGLPGTVDPLKEQARIQRSKAMDEVNEMEESRFMGRFTGS
jgi:hypothetical protein